MSNIVIKAENISKQYRLGQVGTGTLTHDLNRFWHKIRGKEDPYLKIGEANDRSTKGTSDYVWSLQDINFEINEGDAVGIIGRNGAGKSTLLKLLSRVTKPTTGSIYSKGRIASLLEVGTGFHPEMTGRENIFLNGAILGMTRKEITRKFDEIVDFSGVERYIDTPVKRYSSGMYVRLAFAVAAHLESEILIVDEVLAVGDAEFQKKCLGKMGDVSKGEGRTVLFVSHNMAAVETLCSKGILLNQGSIEYKGNTDEIIKKYNKKTLVTLNEKFVNQEVHKVKPYISQALICNIENKIKTIFSSQEDILISLELGNLNYQINLVATIVVRDERGNFIIHTTDEYSNQKFETNHRTCKIPKNVLNEGQYFVTLAIGSRLGELYEKIEDILSFSVHYNGIMKGRETKLKGLISPEIVLWKE